MYEALVKTLELMVGEVVDVEANVSGDPGRGRRIQACVVIEVGDRLVTRERIGAFGESLFSVSVGCIKSLCLDDRHRPVIEVIIPRYAEERGGG